MGVGVEVGVASLGWGQVEDFETPRDCMNFVYTYILHQTKCREDQRGKEKWKKFLICASHEIVVSYSLRVNQVNALYKLFGFCLGQNQNQNENKIKVERAKFIVAEENFQNQKKNIYIYIKK